MSNVIQIMFVWVNDYVSRTQGSTQNLLYTSYYQSMRTKSIDIYKHSFHVNMSSVVATAMF